jgi:hypothetical protein
MVIPVHAHFACQFLPCASALARIAASVVIGVIASGSILTCRIAGLPEAKARSKAGAKSAVF